MPQRNTCVHRQQLHHTGLELSPLTLDHCSARLSPESATKGSGDIGTVDAGCKVRHDKQASSLHGLSNCSNQLAHILCQVTVSRLSQPAVYRWTNQRCRLLMCSREITSYCPAACRQYDRAYRPLPISATSHDWGSGRSSSA